MVLRQLKDNVMTITLYDHDKKLSKCQLYIKKTRDKTLDSYGSEPEINGIRHGQQAITLHAHPFHCTYVMYVVYCDFYCFYVLFH